MLSVCGAGKLPVEGLREMLRLHNRSGRVRRLSVTGYAEWVLGDERPKTLLHVVTERDAETGAVFARNVWNTDFAGRIAFFAIDEVGLIVAAAATLRAEDLAVRCVSMPSWELFEAQPQAYRDDVLPPAVTARLAVELGIEQGWHRYTGDRGAVLGVDRFGASAPAKVLLRQFGFTAEQVVERAKAVLAAR